MLTFAALLNLIALAYGVHLAFRRPGLAIAGTLAALVFPVAGVFLVVAMFDATMTIIDRMAECAELAAQGE